jgi:pfkB family carbohydrate kinase
VIVVIGHPLGRRVGARVQPAGAAATIALVAARAGAAVQLVGKVGDDDPGDELVLALAAGGVGHVALLRDAARATPILDADEPDDEGTDPATEPGRPPAIVPADAAARPILEAADVDLGLRYLTDFRVLVVAEPLDAAIVAVAADAARYAGAALLVVAHDGADDVPVEGLVVAGAVDPRDDAVPTLIGQAAAAIAAGADPDSALDAAARRLGATAAQG